MTQVSDLARLIARAIARQEGWLNERSTQFAYRNPGNIYDPKLTKETGKFTFRTYTTFDEGWLDLAQLIQRNLINRKLTLFQFFAGQRDPKGSVIEGGYSGYAPAAHGGNRPRIYADNIGRWLSLPTDSPCDPAWVTLAKPTTKLPLYGASKSSECA